MKLRLYRERLNKVLHWYDEQLSGAFFGAPANNQATLYRMQEHLRHLQQTQHRNEPQSEYWSLPVDVVIGTNQAGQQCYKVVLNPDFENEKCLFLDFDRFPL